MEVVGILDPMIVVTLGRSSDSKYQIIVVYYLKKYFIPGIVFIMIGGGVVSLTRRNMILLWLCILAILL